MLFFLSIYTRSYLLLQRLSFFATLELTCSSVESCCMFIQKGLLLEERGNLWVNHYLGLITLCFLLSQGGGGNMGGGDMGGKGCFQNNIFLKLSLILPRLLLTGLVTFWYYSVILLQIAVESPVTHIVKNHESKNQWLCWSISMEICSVVTYVCRAFSEINNITSYSTCDVTFFAGAGGVNVSGMMDAS